MLQYLSEGPKPETNGLRELCERELGMNAEDYRTLVGQLLRDGMVEGEPHPDSLSITAEGRFLLIGGGYGIRVLSWDYQRKQRRAARQETAKAILNRGRTALRWGKLGTVVRQKPGALGRNQPGTFTRGGREATKRPGHPVAPDPDWLPVP
ncbi:MAG: hypothetical protein H7Z75_20215, partial [Ferruginibacter sp.]|nr:hypothetical protein [Cytophagales bacterium]